MGPSSRSVGGSALGALTAALLLLGSVSSASADERLADLVERVAPSVVNLHTSGVHDGWSYWDAFFGGPRRWESLGSGFVVDAGQGLIVTNQHVVGRAGEIRVMDHQGRVLDAELLGSDEGIDLAVLRVNTRDLPAVELGDSGSLRVGDDVFAVGNPYGHGHTVTRGILSARARSLGRDEFDLFMQTDAAINPGSSGGPLFDEEGRVVGINTAIDSRGEAIGFAMPVELLKGALGFLVEGGDVAPGWPGLRLEEGRDGRLRVAAVYPEGPSASAGMRVGDIIVTVDGETCRGREGWTLAFGSAFPGQARTLSLLRDGAGMDLQLVLADREAWARRQVGAAVAVQSLRVVVQGLPPDLGDRLAIGSGVYVVRTERGAFFQQGDIVIEVNGQLIASPRDLQAAGQLAARQRRLVAIIYRGGSRVRILQRW